MAIIIYKKRIRIKNLSILNTQVRRMKMKLVLCFLLLFYPLFTTTTKAIASNEKEEAILVYGDDLSMVFLISIRPSQTIAIRTLPSNSVIPAVCANNQVVTLSSLNDQACLTSSLMAAYPIDIVNTIYISTQKIEEDFKVSKRAKELSSFADMQIYFHELGSQLSFSIIFSLHHYIKTYVSLSDLYTYYQLYTADDLSIQYYFLHLIQLDFSHWISLDTAFYKTDVNNSL